MPDREYFFNVLATYSPDYVRGLIEHANLQRNAAGAKNTEETTIQISNDWLNALQAIPFVSQHRGSTVHLLKAGSAKAPKQRKRKQIDIHMTPLEFMEGREEVKQEEPMSQMD